MRKKIPVFGKQKLTLGVKMALGKKKGLFLVFHFRDIEDAKRFAAPERKVLKTTVRSSIDSLISGAKAESVKGTRRPSLGVSPPPSADAIKNLRFNLPDDNKQTEKSITGVSIQPSGTYPLGRSPRSSPDTSEGGKNQTEIPVRHSLSQEYHKNMEKKPYTMSHVGSTYL